MKERYSIIKTIYKDYLIFIKNKNKYILLNDDKLISKYFDINVNINRLYLDNLEISNIIEYEDNKYQEYLIKSKLINLLRKELN